MKILTAVLLAAFVLQFFSTMPFIMVAVILIAIERRDEYVFLLAVFLGAVLDLLAFESIGVSAIFFTVVIFLVLSYQSKFEIETGIFVFIASFFSTFLYLQILGFHYSLLQAVVCGFLGMLIFHLHKKLKINLSLKTQY